MFRMLIHPSSGACDLLVELLHGLYLVRCVLVLEWKWNLMAHGDAREEKWKGKRRMERVASSFKLDSEQSIQCYYNRSPSTRTARKPVLDWTDTPADINELVRFAGRQNLVSARVPSQPFSLYVAVWLWWCGIRMQAEALPQPAYGYHTTIATLQRNTNTHRTRYNPWSNSTN